MTIYNWFPSNGSFSSTTNWGGLGPPGIGDTAAFFSGAYTVTGGGAVSVINVASGGINPMTFDGNFYADSYLVNGNVQIASTGTWTVTGNSAINRIVINTISNAGASLVVNGTVTSIAPLQTTNFGLLVDGQSSLLTGKAVVQGTTAHLDTGVNGAIVGVAGYGRLDVLAGATAAFSGSSSGTAALAIGLTSIGNGLVNVLGDLGNSLASSIVASGAVYVGHGGTGRLSVNSLGTFTGGSAASGATPSTGITIGDGSATLDATGNAGNTTLFGGTGTASVYNRGTLTSLGDLRVGYDGSQGTLEVSTSGNAFSAGQIMVGGGTDHANGSGSVTVSAGTVRSGGTHTTGVAGIIFGNDASTTGTGVIGLGGVLDANGDRITVADSGSGSLTIYGGGSAVAGSGGYSDREAALAVAASAGSSGSIIISGGGAQLVALGDAVIGGSESNGVVTRGGRAVVTITSGGRLQAAFMTVLTGSTVSVDASSTLSVPNILIDGGTLTMNSLAGTTVTFGATGTLGLTALTGANAISTFGIGDKIDLLGITNATLASNVVSVGSATLSLNAAAAGYAYALSSDGNGGIFVTLNALSTTLTPTMTPITNNTPIAAPLPVSRFFSNADGGHFFTFDPTEIAGLITAGSPSYRSDLTLESGGFGAISAAAAKTDVNSIQVYRFFDSTTGAHFFTDSTAERDSLINPLSPAYKSTYVYEPNSTFYEHVTKQAGDVAVYRFFDTTDGTHFYTGSQKENDQITAPGTATFRPDLIAEGIAFYAPANAAS